MLIQFLFYHVKGREARGFASTGSLPRRHPDPSATDSPWFYLTGCTGCTGRTSGGVVMIRSGGTIMR